VWRRPAVMFQMHTLAAGTVINFSWAAGIKRPADDCCGLRVGCEISAVQALAAAARPVTMSINQITGGGGGLGSESAGTMRPRMAQHCGPTAAVVVSCDPTFAPRTPTTSPENNCRVHLSLVCPRRGLVKGACVQEGGKCPVPAPTVQNLRHALRVNKHTRLSALVDRAGSPCRVV